MTNPADVDTCATDGTHFLYNPDFIKGLTAEELMGVFAHEVLHCVNGHPWREGAREHQRWNYACDYAINPIILEAEMKLPSCALVDAQYSGMSAEHIYNILPETLKGPAGCGMGEVRPAPSGDRDGGDNKGQGQIATKSDWVVAAVQAATAAKMMGKLPGSIERLIDTIVNPKVDWRAALQNLVQQSLARDDYSWSMPNNRYTGRGLFLPSLRSERIPPLVVVVDTSGSIGARELAEFGAEVTSIANQCKPEKIYVLYVDSEVNSVEEYLPGESIELTPHGGGGTNMPVAFDWIEEESVEAAACIILTDGYTPFGEAQSYPVIWAINGDAEAPHGTTLDIR